MIRLDDLKKVRKIKGVDHFIIIDRKGRVAASNIDLPGKTAEMIYSCGRRCRAIGKSRFTYCLFYRKNKRHFFIFPVGKHYLGVVKQENTDNFILTGAVKKFLADFE